MQQKFLYGIIGLLLGLIIGFLTANNINKSAILQSNAAQNSAANQLSQDPKTNNVIVKDQPASSAQGKPLPEVGEKIDKAKNEPDNFAAQIAAGDLYLRIKGFEKAIEFYEKANRIKPDDYQTIVKIGNAYFDSDQYEKAEKWYENALSKNPGDVSVRTDYGLTFFLREPKDIDRAIKEYQISLAKNPNHELTLQNLAVALREKGDTQGFQEVMSRLEKVNPQNPAIQKFKQGVS